MCLDNVLHPRVHAVDVAHEFFMRLLDQLLIGFAGFDGLAMPSLGCRDGGGLGQHGFFWFFLVFLDCFEVE